MKRFLIAAIVCIPTLAHAQMPPPPPPGHALRFISVSGEAHREVAPDQAVLNVSVESRNMNLTEAKQANDALTKKVRKIALDLEIPEKNIATSNLFVSPQYNYDNNKQVFAGYMISRSLRVTMDSVDVHERLLSEIIAAGVDQVSGVEFKIAKPETHEQKLRAEAVKDAEGKAKILAEAAGVELGKPISIFDGVSGAMPPPMPMMKAMRMEATDAAGSVAPALPGMIRLEQNVSVVYEIK